MKRGLIFVLFIVLLITFSQGKITVHDVSIKETYKQNETIIGDINITLKDELFTQELISSAGEKMKLVDFLDKNYADYSCKPEDCSNDYEIKSNEKNVDFMISKDQTTYLGFSLTGNKAYVTSLNFTLSSNFQEGKDLPLEIEFFERTGWIFSEFSSEYTDKDWGCYNDNLAEIGPFISTANYCELINLEETGSINMGAKVSIKGSEELSMSLYPGVGGSLIKSCRFSPTSEEGCDIESHISKGDYQVCVGPVSSSKPTDHRIYTESAGTNCGFAYENGPKDPIKDYAIFAQSAKYEDASKIEMDDFDLEKIAKAADDLLESKYNRDCSNNCFLPIKINGVSQAITLTNIDLRYRKDSEDLKEENIIILSVLPSIVDYSGILKLDVTNFNLPSSEKLAIYLGATKLFEKTIEIIKAPEIYSINPVIIPAGVPTNIKISYSKNENSSISAEIENKKIVIENDSFEYTFERIKNYTIEVSLKSNEFNIKEKFKIDVISPRDYIKTELIKKDNQLKSFIEELNSFPDWYGGEIKEMIDISDINIELQRIKAGENKTINDTGLTKLAKDLSNLIIPKEIFIENYPILELTSDLEKIDPKAIDAQVNSEKIGEYTKEILDWQDSNTKTMINLRKISIEEESNESLYIYELDIKSYSTDNSFLVISKTPNELTFKESTPQESNKKSVIEIGPEFEKSISFYTKDSEEIIFFISPSLRELIIGEIDKTCNYNKICESNNGENSKTCRNDCPPKAGIITLSIIALLFVIFLYTLIQIWYKRRYEGHLFYDRNQLYNLLMYVTNAKARGTDSHEIVKSLKAQGWSKERIVYVLKKSQGKNTGLPEIIPISFISSKMRLSKAKKRVATLTRRQDMQKINKQPLQRQFR